MAKKTMTLEHIDFSITRWKSRLRRAMTAIDKLEKQRKRVATKAMIMSVEPPVPDLAVAPPLAKAVKPAEWSAANPVEDEIPAFLRRQSPDPVAEQIRQEQAETKRKKAVGRIATMKAKKSGETRKMPLTGKAALAAIRG